MATDRPRTGDSTGSIVAVVVGVLAISLLMNTCGADEVTPRNGTAVRTAPTTVTTRAATAATPSFGVGGQPRLGAPGSPVTLTAVEVLSVPADEGFWVGSGPRDRVWVELTGGPPESPYDVDKGDRVSFSGRVAANAEDFAERSGVTDAEGRQQLTAQGRHLQVDKGALKLSH